jgi:MoaA/NifB/PqqE/SkfB family radical SAM enzyme
MSCAWCYVPFGGPRPDPGYCWRIVERVAEIGFQVITFGGGDPMMYPFLPDIVSAAKSRGLFVHIDTNGIGLRCSAKSMRFLESQVDLIGLPLDGPDAATHNRMRSSPAHFDLLMAKLEWLSAIANKMKINTIVTAENGRAVIDMLTLVGQIAPARWSLYQYWPLSTGALVTVQHRISDGDFAEATRGLPQRIGTTCVEVNPLPVRRLTYPFVSQDGSVYVHSGSDLTAYDPLGSIFDDGTVASIMERCGPEREGATSRYSRGLVPPDA